MGWQVGVDIGGTFIDFCAYETDSDRLVTLKVLTTPHNPGSELLDGLERLERLGVAPRAIETFVHGTTVGVNTVIQRKGARLALICNAGFEDVIELGRLRLPDMYSLFCAAPEPLIPRNRVFGVSGRMLADGSESAQLELEELGPILSEIRAQGVDGVVVAFLHASTAPQHEHAVKAALARMAPDLFVFTSAEVWPVIREYERTTTAILNGYVHPRIAGYLTGLEDGLASRGVPAQPLLTKSNGGLMNAAAGKRDCVHMLLSGTASGVTGAAFLAAQAGVENVLTLDIGGTSADIALIINGAAQFDTDERIGDFPLHLPTVSVSSIGIGGGSIAKVDGLGVLKVGPDSAGSAPGPACYGRGGVHPTVTDAMAVLGALGHSPMAYNALSIDVAAARQSITPLAEQMGRSVEQTAKAVVDVAVSEMFLGVEKLASRYGVDLQDFTLMPFGGGGPMLGCFLARELGMAHVLAPRRPGVVSALGGLAADLKGDFVRTLFVDCDEAARETLLKAADDLAQEGRAWLQSEQGEDGPVQLLLSAEMRYAGQSFEIDTPIDPQSIFENDFAAIEAAFHKRHQEVYDFYDPQSPVEIITLRLTAIGRRTPISTPPAELKQGEAAAPRHVAAHLDGALREETPLFHPDALWPGAVFTGPAIVAQEDSTLVAPSGFKGRVDAYGNIHLRREA